MAKGIIASLLVNVSSKGAGKTKAELNDVAKAAVATGAAHELAATRGKNFYNAQEKGIIGTANSTKSFSKLAQTINGGGSSSVVAAYATLMANVFSLTAAFNALKGAAQVQQVEAGLNSLGQRMGQTLTTAAKDLKTLTDNTISTEQAMRSAAQVFSAGFKSDDLERIGAVARDASFALGREMTDSMDRLTRGVIKMEPELLDELGIMTRMNEATKAYAETLGKAESQLTTSERRFAFFNAVMTEGEAKYSGLAEAAGNTRGWDKLSSTFSDLLKTLLNVINKGMLPLANLFSNSPMALAGGMLLFASTIKSQMLPGLASLQEKNRAVAEAFRDIAEEQAEARAKIRERLQDEQERAIAKTVNLPTIEGMGKNTKYNQLLKAMQDDPIAALDDEKGVKAAVNGLSTSIRNAERAQKDLNATSAEYIAIQEKITLMSQARHSLTVGIKEERVITEGLKAAKLDLDAADRQLMITKTKADAQNAQSRAMEAASINQYITSMGEYKKGVIQYNQAQNMSIKGNGVMAKSLIVTRTAAFAASGAVRLLGVAFMNMIPFIGWAVTILGALKMAFDFLRPEHLKKRAEAVKGLSDAITTFTGQQKELERLGKSGLSAAQMEIKANELRTNNLKNLQDALQNVADTYNSVNSPKGSKSINEMISGIDDGSDAYKIFNKTAMETIGWVNKQNTAYRKTFVELQNANPEVIELAGGMETLMKLSEASRINALNDALKRVAENSALTNAAILKISESLQGAGKAYKDFASGLGGTSKLDSMVSQLGSLFEGIAEARMLGEPVDTQLLAGGDMSSLLSARTQSLLEEDRLMDALVKKGKDRNAAEQLTLDLIMRKGAREKVSAETVEAELTQMHQLVTLEQRRLILSESQSAVASAILNKYKESWSVSAAGIGKQIDQENKIIDFKIQGYKFETQILQVELEREKLKLQDLQIQLSSLDAQKQAYQWELNRLEIARERLDKEHKISMYAWTGVKKAMEEDKYKKESEATTERISKLNGQIAAADARKVALTSQISRQTTEIALTQTKIAAISNTVYALELGKTTEVEKQYAMNKKILELFSEQQKQYESAADVVQKMMEDQEAIANIQNSVTATVASEVRHLKARQKLEMDRLKVAQAIARANIENQLYAAKQDANKADEVKQLEHNLEILEQSHRIAVEGLETAHRRAEVELTQINIFKEGLEVQQKSLEYAQKIAEVRSEHVNSALALRNAEDELQRKRLGYNKNSFDEKAETIRAATAAYQLAVQESELKKALIELEYGLLQAQAAQLEAELRAKAIEQRDPVAKAQLTAAADNARRAGAIIPQAMEMAKTVVDNAVKTAKAELQTLLVRGSGNENPFRSQEGYRRAMQEASSVLATEVAKPLQTVIPPMQQALEAVATPTEALAKQLEGIRPILEVIATKLGGTAGGPASGALSGKSAREIVALIGQAATAAGIRADEHPDLGDGRVGEHSARSLHYSGRAVDLNIGYGNDEWSNPAMRTKIQSFMDAITSAGGSGAFESIFGSSGHTNHGHLGIKDLSKVDLDQLAAVLFRYLPNAFAAATPPSAGAGGSEEVHDLGEIEVRAKRGTQNLETSTYAALDNLRMVPPLIMQAETASMTWSEILEELPMKAGGLIDIFNQLGPSGAAMNAVIEGASIIASKYDEVTKAFGDGAKTGIEGLAQKVTAIGGLASASLSTISQVYSNASQARIDAIDQEIAAEQKRDGKSAESVAKIKALEAKKEAIAKKAFDVNKKLMMAQAVIATATGITQALASSPPPGNIIMAGIIGAMGAAQLAMIAGTSYQSANSSAADTSNSASALTIGKRGDSVDLAKNNANAGGELAYLRGSQGYGRSASDYVAVGSAYGGSLARGYGNAAYLVGEQGPEFVVPEAPSTVVPSNQANQGNPVNATFNINTLDASGVQDVLHSQRGFIIGSIREAANANGESFLENVSTDVYTKPNVGKL